jgi:DNA primase large subunit
MQSLTRLATYPFLEDAKLYVKKEAPTIQELLRDPIYERSHAVAVERLEKAFQNKNVGVRGLTTESDCIMELFSYPIARMIACCINDVFFTRRYALGEAVHMYRNLLKESPSFLIEIAKEFNLNVQRIPEQAKFSIYFTHYLHYAPTRYKTWKMINREMTNGYITLTHKDLARLLQEALRERINTELDGKPCHEMVRSLFSSEIHQFQRIVAKYRKKIETIPIGRLDIEKLPPCMKQILTAMQSGENVPHMGRFALVAFLHSIKLGTEEILQLFNRAPDFEEEKTRYQIEHITGDTSATSYKAPGCDKLKTYGICPIEDIDDLCKRIPHPISYYQEKWKKKE